MGFIGAHTSSRSGCVLTLGLAGVLLLAFWFSGGVDVPTVLRLETDRAGSSVSDCLKSPEANRLLGRLSKVPIGNPYLGRRLNRREILYSTARGHLILVYTGPDETLVRVKGRGTLTEDQISLLRRCSDRLAMW